MSVQGREEHIRSKNLCTNCLAPGHQGQECRSWARCRQCGGKHHTMIHKERRTQAPVNVITPVVTDSIPPNPTVPMNLNIVCNATDDPITSSVNVACTNTDKPINPIQSVTQSLSLPNCLMMTGKVLVKGPGGRQVMARALLDSGSSMTLVSAKLAKSAQLPQQSKTVYFTGAQDTPLKQLQQLLNCKLALYKVTKPSCSLWQP